MEFRFENRKDLLDNIELFPENKPIDFISSHLGITQYITDTFFISAKPEYFNDIIRVLWINLKQDGEIKKIKLSHDYPILIKFK